MFARRCQYLMAEQHSSNLMISFQSLTEMSLSLLRQVKEIWLPNKSCIVLPCGLGQKTSCRAKDFCPEEYSRSASLTLYIGLVLQFTEQKLALTKVWCGHCHGSRTVKTVHLKEGFSKTWALYSTHLSRGRIFDTPASHIYVTFLFVLYLEADGIFFSICIFFFSYFIYL